MNQVVGIKEMIDSGAMVGPTRSGTRRFWTGREEKVLRETYPTGGVAACFDLLEGRSAGSIYQHAAGMGLKAPAEQGRRKGWPRQRWTSSSQIDAVITTTYQRAPTKGDINRLAQTLNRPRYWVSQRALTLGLVLPRFKEPPWTEPEIEIAAANAHKTFKTIARILKGHGFVRTPTAVMVKLKRLGHATGRNADIDRYTATALSKLFGIDTKGVTAWIAKGWLKAEKRGTARTSEQGGDEYSIHRRDIRRFVIENAAAVDLRKVEKFWFIELLTGAQS